MAKFKGKGVVAAGLLAGAASFLSKKENRDKAMELLNNITSEQKGQGASTNMEVSNDIGLLPTDFAETAANSLQVDENKFISEGGAQKLINDYNYQQHTD